MCSPLPNGGTNEMTNETVIGGWRECKKNFNMK